MNKQELRSLIREEIKKIVKEESQGKFRLAGSDNEGMDDGIFIELKKPFPTDETKAKLIKAAQSKYGVDISFMKNKATSKYAIWIPFAGDYANIMGILKKMNIPNEG